MKASIKVKPPKEASFNNPQDPDLLPFRITEETKKNTKIAVTPYKRMYSDKGFLKYMSIPSSVTSEPDEEIKVEEEPEVDELEKDIEKLFLSVKDECERDRVQPNVYEEYSTEKEIIPLRRHINTSMVNQPTTTVNTDTQEIKPGVVFKITAMGPSRYFKKEEPAIKATNKRFLKRKHRQIKLKLKKEQVLVKDMIDTIISIKAANQEIDE